MDYNCIKVDDSKYKDFVDYALSLSDVITFHIVHFDVFSPEMQLMQEDYRKAHPDEPVVPVDDYSEYYGRMKNITEPIADAVIGKSNDFSYLGYGYGHLCETFKIDARRTQTRDFLLSADSIFSWRYPLFPEDVCFFREGKCWLRTVAHEKLLFAKNISETEAEQLENCGIKFFSDIKKEQKKLSSAAIKEIEKEFELLN